MPEGLVHLGTRHGGEIIAVDREPLSVDHPSTC
jgi:hypothetical protein